MNDSLILLSSNSDLFLYSDSGTQRLAWNKTGKASNEYLDARQFYISENYIYVFNAAQLKIVVYDRDYRYVKNFSPIKNAISKFVVYNDRYICFLNAGGVNDAAISIYDIQTGATTDIGVNSQEDLLLLIRTGAGALTIVADQLLFLSPAALTLHVYNLTQNKLSNTITFDDPEFFVEKIPETATQMMNNNRPSAFQFILDNSVILDVESVDDFIYILADVGKNSTEKYIKVYQLTKELQLIRATQYTYYQMMAPMLHNGEIHFIQYDKNNIKNGLMMYKYWIDN